MTYVPDGVLAAPPEARHELLDANAARMAAASVLTALPRRRPSRPHGG